MTAGRGRQIIPPLKLTLQFIIQYQIMSSKSMHISTTNKSQQIVVTYLYVCIHVTIIIKWKNNKYRDNKWKEEGFEVLEGKQWWRTGYDNRELKWPTYIINTYVGNGGSPEWMYTINSDITMPGNYMDTVVTLGNVVCRDLFTLPTCALFAFYLVPPGVNI